MPAHLRPITTTCNHPGCTKVATKGLFNAANAPCGSYCDTHEAQALRDHQRGVEERKHSTT